MMHFPSSTLTESSDDDSADDEHQNQSQTDYSSSSGFQSAPHFNMQYESSGSEDNDGLLTINPQPDTDNEDYGFEKLSKSRRRSSSNESSEEPPRKKFVFNEPPRKKPYVFNERAINQLATSVNSPIVDDNRGKSIMEKMGYRSGQGLGKQAQGRVEPVEMSKQRGRRGLGLKLPGLDPEDLKWDPSLEIIKVKEDLDWLNGELDPLDIETLRSWKEEGPKDHLIEKMVDFCDSNLLKNILKGKDVFDQLTGDELMRARSRSNPFETLRNGMFLNRAALKMANIDAAFDFMFTKPQVKDALGNSKSMVADDELLYFADVCAGPGGFSEYVLWRAGWRCKGFGFTLKGDCDFKLGDFFAGSPENFETYYGVKDDGNVFDPDNISSLTEFIQKGTDSRGVHFMMADGGFSVDGQENIQEILSKQLYLCQFAVALSIVRDNGHFVCKLFDLFSPFSAGLVYLMYRAFERISIFKPNTSRPANSERYIICKHKRPDSRPIRDYLLEINERLEEIKGEWDINSIVPLDVLKEDEAFIDYLIQSNNSLGERQVVNLIKIAAFCRSPNLREDKQAEMRAGCLKAWDVPDSPRAFNRATPAEVAEKILPHGRDILFSHPDKKLKLKPPEDLAKKFGSVYDWQCMPLGSNDLHFYLGLGGNRVYRWNFKSWVRESVAPDLKPGTLVFGEIFREWKGEGMGLIRMNAFHLIDVISIGYENISSLPFSERLKMLNLYCKSLERVNGSAVFPVRVKQPYDFPCIDDIFKSLTYRDCKQMRPTLLVETDQYSFPPKGIVFIKTVKEPWVSCLSKSTKHRYFFNTKTKQSEYLIQIDKESVFANIKESMQTMLHWEFEDGVGLRGEKPTEGVVHKDALLCFIAKST